MASRRYGNRVAFWGSADPAGVITGQAVGVGATSRKVELSQTRGVVISINTSAATTVSIEVANSSDQYSKDSPNQSSDTGENWMPLYLGAGTTANKVEIIFASAGNAALMVDDLVPGWIRLRSSAAVTISAGFEARTEK